MLDAELRAESSPSRQALFPLRNAMLKQVGTRASLRCIAYVVFLLAAVTESHAWASNLATGEPCNLGVTTRWQRSLQWWTVAAPALAASAILASLAHFSRQTYLRRSTTGGRFWGALTGVLLAGFTASTCTAGYALFWVWLG